MKSILHEDKSHSYRQYSQLELCCICGQLNCQQAYDHQKITLSQLIETINEKRSNQEQIFRVKESINKFYKELKNNLFILLEKDRYQVLTYVNKFYFPKQFCSKNKIDINMISEIMEMNIEKLPNKKLLKLIQKVQSIPILENLTEIQTLKQKTQTLISQSNIKTILQSLKEILPSSGFKQEIPDLKLKSRKTTSFSDTLNPQQENNIEKQKNYEWRNIKVTKNSRTVSLSNKNISDLQVMEQVPILANYKNLKQFEIRNNKISCLSCNIIANNMPFLLSVDIRGNKITDKGIIKLVRGIPKLKTFFISETLATDQSGQEIIEKLHDLQILWSEYTRLSNEVALRIASKPKLKVLSLVGNPIDDQYKEKMKKIFISKGYISI